MIGIWWSLSPTGCGSLPTAPSGRSTATSTVMSAGYWRALGQGSVRGSMMANPPPGGRPDGTAEARPPAQPLSLFTVLQQEFEELHGAPGASAQAGGSSGDLEDLYRRIHALEVPPAALCLSGG